MKKLFFVIGPESSGTRLTTRILCESGCFGDFEHYQRLDEFVRGNTDDLNSITNGAESIVFRRSVPHGEELADIDVILDKFNEFIPYIIISIRNLYELCCSKINNNGKKDLLDAYNSVKKEMDYISGELVSVKKAYKYTIFNTSFLFKFPDIPLNDLAIWSDLDIDRNKVLSFLYDADFNHVKGE